MLKVLVSGLQTEEIDDEFRTIINTEQLVPLSRFQDKKIRNNQVDEV